jgi:hypothetical protein
MHEHDAPKDGEPDGSHDHDSVAARLTFSELQQMDDAGLAACMEALLVAGPTRASQREWEAALFERTRRDASKVAAWADILAKRTELFTRATTLGTLAAVWLAGMLGLINVGIPRPFAVVAMTLFFMYWAWQIGTEALQVAPLPDDMHAIALPLRAFWREVVEFGTPSWVRKRQGVEAVLWHTTPLPAYPLFQKRAGYGGRFPWTVPPASREITYDTTAFPEATSLLHGSLLLGSERYPLAGQDASVIAYVVEAFRKVHSAVEELVAAEKV